MSGEIHRLMELAYRKVQQARFGIPTGQQELLECLNRTSHADFLRDSWLVDAFEGDRRTAIVESKCAVCDAIGALDVQFTVHRCGAG